MSQSHSPSFRNLSGTLPWLAVFAIVAALGANYGCTNSHASASPNHATASPKPLPGQSLPHQTQEPQSAQPPANLSPELTETYRKAQSGDAKAMAKLGEAYEKGEGAPEDIHQAIAWFTKSAEAGDSSAMVRLGRMYATGSGVEKNYKEALHWYKKAAADGNTEAMYDVGRAYENGAGVQEDVQQAVNWYDTATLHGNKDAKAALDRLGEDFDH